MNNIDNIFQDNLKKCHYPFLWLSNKVTVESVVQTVERIYQAGCDGLIVEPREYTDFEKGWWDLLDAILKKAEELGVQIIVVDEDSRCPTGHAFGWTSKLEYKHLKRWSLVESHVDVIGPKNVDIVVGYPLVYVPLKEKDELIGCFAYKRLGNHPQLDLANPINLTENIKEGILSWDVPEGEYRIEYIYKSQRYCELYNDDFIDMTSDESVDLLIESTYKEYEKRYAKYFGNTLLGFFSDEPYIGNSYPYCGTLKYNMYSPDCKIGKLGLSMPYNEGIKADLDAIYGKDVLPLLVSLWYWDEEIAPTFRSRYMNVLAQRYRKCFSEKVGAWCKERGLLYTGHILEDNGSHSRLGGGGVHYFHSQMGQDIPGIDVVMNQVMPGFSDNDRGGHGTRVYNSEFYHYTLGKLNSSAAHTYSKFNGNAMCEATIGYGWAEGTQLAKWLFDFFMVRGTNFFVSGAIRPVALDNLHSPHWGDNEGKDPQGKGYAKLIDYSKKVLTCLDGSQHIANVALLYHAQGEWMSDEHAMLIDQPAKRLYDAHIDFDILCEELLKDVQVIDGKCKVLETYDCIVVPYAERLPEFILEHLEALKEQGADVVFIERLPKNTVCDFTVVALSDLASYCQNHGYTDVQVENFHQLRHYHCVKDGVHTYMFFNESATRTFEGNIYTGKQGNYNIYDFIGEAYYQGQGGENVALRLEPYQSVVVVYEPERGFSPYIAWNRLKIEELQTPTSVSLYRYDDMQKLYKHFEQEEIRSISKEEPTFSGKIVYTFPLCVKNKQKTWLKFDDVGENAQVFVNDIDCGFVICNPFIYDITKGIREGGNQVRVEVYTTLANAIQDPVSLLVPMARTGISGKIKVLRE